MELLPNAKYDHAFAIVRVDGDQFLPGTTWENVISVVKIVHTEEKAQSEVRRLNELNRTKNAYYFSKVARIERL